MLNDLWNLCRRLFGPTVSLAAATLSRAAVDPVSSRLLMQVHQPVSTIRLKPEREGLTVFSTNRIEMTWHGITDPGMVRPNNEDSLAYLETADGALFVVADGMGGHDAGEAASSIAAETVKRTVQAGCRRNEEPLILVERAIKEANTAVRREARHRGSNMGTTLAVVLVAGSTAYIANVGDSRTYWVEHGSLRQITADHSIVAQLVDSGRLTTDEARNDPRSNLLYRSVGSDDQIVVDTYRFPLSKGGKLLVCSDGLWGEMRDDDLLSILSDEDGTEAICARLVQRANANGGRDNITAIAVHVG